MRYLAATLTEPDATLIPARTELADVRWWPVTDAMPLLKTARREVLQAVLTALAA